MSAGMNTTSMQSFIARMTEGAEPEVEIRKSLLRPADPDDLDQRGLYQVEVVVKTQ